jgi:hypothetical protein
MFELNKDWKYQPSPGPQISAYTTTFNCLKGNYPVKDSISSFKWCDKIVVVDGGSTDGTRELLQELADSNPKLVIYDLPIDTTLPGKDGMQKALAMAMLDTPMAVQFDIDEICIGSPSKWREAVKEMASGTDILSLPVIEPIGKKTRIRMNKEHTPWKWRIFRVKPEITHGIPASDRNEIDGVVYSKGGSDGCFPIHCVTNEMIPSKTSKSAKQLTESKSSGDKEKHKEAVLSLMNSGEPAILHLGHVDLVNKISHYLNSWHSWWCCLYNKDPNDPKNNLYFPGVLVSDVTQEMVESKARELMESTPHVDLE